MYQSIGIATEQDREVIYKLRYKVYAEELGQYPKNLKKKLKNDLDNYNTYIVAKCGNTIQGFISITPPNPLGYSTENHLRKNNIHYSFAPLSYEKRLLTVIEKSRGSSISFALIIAANLWIHHNGGTNVIALGRTSVLDYYTKLYFEPTDVTLRLGSIHYTLMDSPITKVDQTFKTYKRVLKRLQSEYNLGFFNELLSEKLYETESSNIYEF